MVCFALSFDDKAKATVEEVKDFMKTVVSEVEEGVLKEVNEVDKRLGGYFKEFMDFIQKYKQDFNNLIENLKKESMESLEYLGEKAEDIKQTLQKHFTKLEVSFQKIAAQLGKKAEGVMNKVREAGEELEDIAYKGAQALNAAVQVTNFLAKIPGVGDNAGTLTLALLVCVALIFGSIFITFFVDLPPNREGIVYRLCVQENEYQIITAGFIGIQVILPVLVGTLSGGEKEEENPEASEKDKEV